jgi:predicted membrane metal-binding protein
MERKNMMNRSTINNIVVSAKASLSLPVAARNIFGWVGRHFNVIITFFIMFVVIAGKEFLC